MDSSEYKAAKARSGIGMADIWCARFRLSRDQDKSMAMGRTAVPAEVEFQIKEMLADLEEGAQELAAELRHVLPSCKVSQDADSLAIEITFASGRKVQLLNHGIDTLNFWPIFEAEVPLKDAALFLRVPVRSRDGSGPGRKRAWVLWRGDFADSYDRRRRQNNANLLEEGLLLEAFKRFA